MKTNNKLDKAFGPVGTTAGIVLFVVGLITTFTSLFGLILILLGAFVGFTSTSTFIDFDQKRIKFSNNIFGIIPTGKWIPIDSTMKIGIQESDVTWRTYSRGNRALDIEDHDFRIVLFDSVDREILQIKKMKSQESSEAEVDSLCSQLGINRI
jgi:hypothetical protein